MALIEITVIVPEEYADLARAYALEHVGIQLRERLEREALAPAQDAAAAVMADLWAANTPTLPETPAESEG